MSNPEIDVAYNARATVSPDTFDRLMAEYRSQSVRSIERLQGHPAISYDQRSDEKLDIWGVEPHELRPVVLAIHGGYWRQLSRHDTAFMAKTLAEAGVATVSLDYSLAPSVPLSEIVRQTRTAVAWINENGAEYGLDPRRIFVVGSSAGGHLAAMVGIDGWQSEFGVPADTVKGMLLMSGLFDLRPLVDSFANEWLQLDPERAKSLSPLFGATWASSRRSALVVVAEHESSGFQEQSAAFHDAWSAHSPSEFVTVPSRNHFDVFLDLADPTSDIVQRLVEMIREVPS